MQSLLSAEGGVALPAAVQAHICHTAGRPLARNSSKSVHNNKKKSFLEKVLAKKEVPRLNAAFWVLYESNLQQRVRNPEGA